MKIKLDPANPQTWPKGLINAERLDATTESELAVQQESDDESAAQDAQKACARKNHDSQAISDHDSENRSINPE